MIQTKDCIEALSEKFPEQGKGWKRLSKREDDEGRFIRAFQSRKEPGLTVTVTATEEKILDIVIQEGQETGDEVENALAKIQKALGAKKPKAPAKKAGKGKGKVEFYWQYCQQEDIPHPCFTITPKGVFDATGYASDKGYGSEDFPEGCMPEGFYELMESEFEFNGTREEAEALLRADPRFEERQMFP